MADNLRDRIERIIEDHTLINGADECTCGVLWEIQPGFLSADGSTCYDNHLAGVIAEFLVTDEKREPAPPENETLRDRIAAAIYNASDEYARHLMVRPDCPGASEIEGDHKPVCYTLADAVIAELKLHPVESLDRRFIRWVTAWRNNPELGGEHDE